MNDPEGALTDLLGDINGVGVPLEDAPAGCIRALPAECKMDLVGVASGDVQVGSHRPKPPDPFLECGSMWGLCSVVDQPSPRMAHLMG